MASFSKGLLASVGKTLIQGSRPAIQNQIRPSIPAAWRSTVSPAAQVGTLFHPSLPALRPVVALQKTNILQNLIRATATSTQVKAPASMEQKLQEQQPDKTNELLALISKLEHEKAINIQALKENIEKLNGATPASKFADPAAVGLAGFGLNTFLLQFHNLGYMAGVGTVVWSGLVLGGAAQLIAGFQEYQRGNNFGYSAFVTYGAFWIALCLMWMGDKIDVHKTTSQEKAWFFVTFTLYTACMTLGAAKISKALFTTFLQLLAGFVILDFHLFYPEEKSYQTAAGVVLTSTALNALYCMMNVVMTPLFKRPMFPVGKPPF